MKLTKGLTLVLWVGFIIILPLSTHAEEGASGHYSMVTGPSRSYLRILSRNEMQDQDIFAEFVARAKKWDFDIEKLICVEHDKKGGDQ